MYEFKLIHGRLSINYDLFREYEFAGCRAVAVRLMGVTALKVTWRGRNNRRARLYQVIHLDYSEYGVDEYREFECIPDADDYSEQREDMNGLWNHFVAVMGGELVQIDAPCMLRLIESALPLAEEGRTREYDDEENRNFRAYARLRLGFMRNALNSEGITSADCSLHDAIAAASPLRLSAYETINYFIMRLVDLDFDAASFLSTIDRASLADSELTDAGIQTLVRCDISRSTKKKDPPEDGSSFPFRCRITTLGRECYYYATFVIWLNGNVRSKNPLVTEIKVGSVLRLSTFEAAIQINRPEYLTVFDCKDEMLKGFDARFINYLSNSEPQAVPNGWLYTAYKGDNSHVDSPSYRMNDDVYGYALLSIPGELVLMSHDFRNITMLDDAVLFSAYSSYMNTKGRFRLDSSVFQILCQNQGCMFEELIEPLDDDQ